MKNLPKPRLLYAACLLLALLAGSIIVRSMDLAWTSLAFIALALGGGFLAFVAGVMLLLRGKRAKKGS